MMPTTENSWWLSIKRRISDNQFLTLITPTVMPDQCTAIAIKPTAGSITPPARAKKIHSGTTQIKIGMIIHSIACRRPKWKCIITISPYIAINNNGTCSTSKDRHLVGGSVLNSSSIIVIYCQTANDTIVSPLLQHNHTIAHRFSMILSDGPCLSSLG